MMLMSAPTLVTSNVEEMENIGAAAVSREYGVRWRQTVPPVSNAAAQDLVVCEHFVQCALVHLCALVCALV